MLGNPTTVQLLRRLSDALRRLERLESLESLNVASGTWTPEFEGTGTVGTFTYAKQIGNYVRVGRLVYIDCRVAISAITVAPTGAMRIINLPFTAAAGQDHPLALGYISNFNYTASVLQLTAAIAPSTTQIRLYETSDNATAVWYLAPGFTNANCDLILSGVYRAA